MRVDLIPQHRSMWEVRH